MAHASLVRLRRIQWLGLKRCSGILPPRRASRRAGCGEYKACGRPLPACHPWQAETPSDAIHGSSPPGVSAPRLRYGIHAFARHRGGSRLVVGLGLYSLGTNGGRESLVPTLFHTGRER